MVEICKEITFDFYTGLPHVLCIDVSSIHASTEYVSPAPNRSQEMQHLEPDNAGNEASKW